MLTIKCVLTFSFVINIIFTRAERLSPEEPYAIENHDLEMKVIDVKPPVKSCQILFKSSTLEYHINNGSEYKNVLYIENDEAGECGVRLHPAKELHKGIWSFYVEDGHGRVKKFSAKLTVEILPEKPNEILKNVTDTRINFLYKSSSTPIPSCSFERPDGMVILLIEGIPYERYSYYGSGFNKGDCGLSIEKPLQDHDYGTWKCIADPTRKLGGFINIRKDEETSRSLADIIKGTNSPVINALEGDRIDISCYAQESLAYCYAKSPKGKIHWSTHSGLLIGQCKVQIKMAGDDRGAWICGMGVQGYKAGYEDLEVEIQVHLYEGPLIRSNEHTTKVNLGESTEIACRTTLDVGVKYCLFTRPDETHIIVGPNENEAYGKSSYTYSGKGFEKGDCSLLINSVTKKDIGGWKCTAPAPSIFGKSIRDNEVYMYLDEK